MSKRDRDQVQDQIGQTTDEEQVAAINETEGDTGITDGDKKLTDEERKAHKAAANKAWAERRKAARPKVVQFLKDNEASLKESGIYDDLALFVAADMRTPKAKAEKSLTAAPTTNAELRALLEQGPVSEMDIFTKFRIGRPDMKLKIRAFILAKPEDRIWVKFDEATETYSIVAKGADAPADWDGYKPVAKPEL